MQIAITYIDTSDADYRDWQLDPDQPMLICIDCHQLVPRHHPRNYQILCHQCHEIKTLGDSLWVNIRG